MQPIELVKKYLSEKHMMQLATVSGQQPWCCTVYFIHDEANNLYWASLPSRRHSQEIASNPLVAAAIPVRHVKGDPVTGIQFSGKAEMLEPSSDIRLQAEQYAAKFGRDQAWVDDFVNGKTEHRLYKLTPSEIVLFDEVSFPDSPRVICQPASN